MQILPRTRKRSTLLYRKKSNIWLNKLRKWSRSSKARNLKSLSRSTPCTLSFRWVSTNHMTARFSKEEPQLFASRLLEKTVRDTSTACTSKSRCLYRPSLPNSKMSSRTRRMRLESLVISASRKTRQRCRCWLPWDLVSLTLTLTFAANLEKPRCQLTLSKSASRFTDPTVRLVSKKGVDSQTRT